MTGNTCTNNGGTLAPGQTCAVTVTFSPTVTGNSTASLSFSDNVAGSPQSVPLAGSSVPGVQFTPSSLAFSNTARGPLSVNVENTGTEPLNISNIALTGANVSMFGLNLDTCASTITLGQRSTKFKGGIGLTNNEEVVTWR